jgi:FtsP/CotA-like multicopper oxidase with cupredoxin domain
MTTGFGPYETPNPINTATTGGVLETKITASLATVDIGNGVMADAEVYNGAIPGPTLRVNQGDTVIVRLINDLPYPTGIHWHGIELQNSADGTEVTQNPATVGPWPQPVPESPVGGTYLYKFKAPRPGLYWYHPHHHHSTNRVFRGLYGMIIVKDPHEEGLIASGVIPGPSETVELVLSDITVCKTTNDTETYPAPAAGVPEWLSPVTVQNGPSPADLCVLAPLDDHGHVDTTMPFPAGAVPNIHRAMAMPGTPAAVEGQSVLTNGVNVGGRQGTPAAPGPLETGALIPAPRPVQSGQTLRLQIVNCATIRYFRLRLTTSAGTLVPLIRIGGEGGLLDEAIQEGGITPGGFDTKYYAGEILLPPATRADVVAAIPDGLPVNSELTLWTRDYPRTGPVNPGGWAQLPTVPVMHLRVTGPAAATDTLAVGTNLLAATPGATLPNLGAADGTLLNPSLFSPAKIGRTMDIQNIRLTAGGGTTGIDGLVGSLDSTPYTAVAHIGSSRYAENGRLVQLTITNESSAHHPFHLHGFSFQPKSLAPRPGAPPGTPTATYDWGYQEFRDTLDIPAQYRLTAMVLLEDRPLADGMTGGGAFGRWLFHCHIFFHAHSGMISELVVTDSAGKEKPNIDVGGSWVYASIGGTATRRGNFSHPDGLPITLNASMGAVVPTAPSSGGSWTWTYTSAPTDSPSTNYVYITATDSLGKQEQAVFRLKVGGGDDGSDWGDPHIHTVDGKSYDFQAVGEFVLLRDRDGMEIQTRQTPVPSANPITDSHSGLKSCVSVNTAVAARVGSHRIAYQPVGQSGGLQFFLDGEPARLSTGGIDLDGHRVSAFDAGGEVGLRVDYAHHAVLTVTPHFWPSNNIWYMNVNVSHTHADEGLMGPIPKGTWLPVLPSGATVGPMPEALGERYTVLYRTFANAWRVTDTTSLFVYEPGTSTKTFTDEDWPAEQAPCKFKPKFELPGTLPVSISLEEAEQLCQGVTLDHLHRDCVFDVATTGERSFANSYLVLQDLRLHGSTVTITAKEQTRPGDPLTVSATVAPLFKEGSTPTGSVTFLVDGVAAGPPVELDANGHASATLEPLDGGEHEIRAVYSSDHHHHTASSLNLTHRVDGTCDEGIEPLEIRVVLETIEVIDDRDFLGRGEVWFEARVRTSFGGGTEVSTRLPQTGHFHVSDKPGKNVIELDTEIFAGQAVGDLAIQVRGGEEDWLTRDDPLGNYTRQFKGDPKHWLGQYRPGDEALDEEDVGLWRISYRIERV